MNKSHPFAAALLYADRVTLTLSHMPMCEKLCDGCWSVRLISSCEVERKLLTAHGGWYPHNTLPEALDLAATVMDTYSVEVSNLLDPVLSKGEQLSLIES